MCHSLKWPLLILSLSCSWTKFAWARDKQYLTAEKPGSKVTFDVQVGAGGTVLVDYLRSRFYNLGNVLVCECMGCVQCDLTGGRADMCVAQTSTAITLPA